MISMKQLAFSMREMIFLSVIEVTQKNPSFPKGRFRRCDFFLRLSYRTSMRHDFMTDHDRSYHVN